MSAGHAPARADQCRDRRQGRDAFRLKQAGKRFERKESMMNNNKNRMKDRPKSNAELRKIDPKENADAGIIEGRKIGLHDGRHEKNGK